MKPEEQVNILAVDDSPQKLLSFAALLTDPNQNVVTATSGRDALRFLLHQEFAVILLDVNMPGMDGFETAALIRQRKSSEHTPIIFVTSYGDDAHAAHGYSLGAVDYILAPVHPDVLRTKVGVFVELYRKTAQVRLQARALEGRAMRLQKLTEASLAINSARSVEGILRAAADIARGILEAHQAIASSCPEAGCAEPLSAVSLSPEFEPGGARTVVRDAPRLLERLLLGRRALRLPSRPEEEAGWEGILVHPRPPGGWIAAPLATGDGRGLGLLRVLQKREGDFSEEDEEVLTQLAQMSSIAIENIRNFEAREANRMKDEFLATLSHELRTPLSAILGWTRTLRAAPVDEVRAAHGLAVIERNVIAQTRLIDDLLDVSRIVAGKLRLAPRRMRMASVIEAAIEAVRPSSEARKVVIRFENRLGEGEDKTTGDPDRLQQVFWNLLSNAIKFTPPGGRVDVVLGADAAGFEVSVRDTGRGIPPEFLPRVFERFRQADSSTTRAHGGLGIGLAIARHVVELHRGTITAASEGQNRGASFRVLLPADALSVEEHGAGAPSSEPASSPRGRRADLAGLRVLVVEDEPDGRELLAETFRRCGASVAEAADVEEALDLFGRFAPDVLVSDIGLPGEDGFSLLRKVRQLSPEQGGGIPALAVTAYAREGDRRRAYDAGFQAHVAKPFEPLELAALVERLGRAGPKVAASAPTGHGAKPASSDANGNGASASRVLVVEDDGDSREGLRQLLEIWGHPVDVAEDGSQGIEKALERPPDVALIDIGLPDVDGYQVARRLKESLAGHDLFLVALTGYVEPADRARAAESGFDAHLGKPVDPSKLSTLLASRRPQ